MKKLILIICFVPIFSIAQTVQIPDGKFEGNLITAGFDTDGVINGQISKVDALKVTNMDFLQFGYRNIGNLTGINEFSNLEFLSVSLYDFSNFNGINQNFTNLNKLKIISINSFLLNSLDVTSLVALEELNIENKTIDVLEYNKIQKLDFGNSPNFNRLDLGHCPYLENIVLKNNVAASVYITLSSNLPVCIEVDDPVAATNGTAPYDTWTIIASKKTGYYFSDKCTLSVEKFINENFKIYPNPATEYVSIEQKTTNGVTLQAVQILDSSGKWIKSVKENFNQIDVSSLSKGMYLFVIQTDKGNKTEKIIIK